MAELRVVRSELIVGSEGSGKGERARRLAAAWLAQSPRHRAEFMAAERAPVALAHALGQHGSAETLIVVDCLTLWLTATLLDAPPLRRSAGTAVPFDDALASCRGPLVLI